MASFGMRSLPNLKAPWAWVISGSLTFSVSCSQPAADCMEGYVRGESGQCDLPKDTAGLDIEPLAHLESSLQAYWERGFPEPFTLREYYLDFLKDGDSDCPVLMDVAFSPQDCISSSGTHFYGLAFYQEQDRVQNQPGQLFAMQASFELQRPGEEPFVAGGGFGFEVLAVPDEPTDWMSFVQGSFQYPDASGWLAEGVTAGLAIRGSHEGSHYRMNIEGGSGQDETYVFWDSVELDSRICNGHPVGRIGTRVPGSSWVWWTLDDQCNGCGDVEYGGDSMGEFCMDLRGNLESVADQMETL